MAVDLTRKRCCSMAYVVECDAKLFLLGSARITFSRDRSKTSISGERWDCGLFVQRRQYYWWERVTYWLACWLTGAVAVYPSKWLEVCCAYCPITGSGSFSNQRHILIKIYTYLESRLS
jgi:hypothetical protein